MTTLFARQALLPEGWHDRIRLKMLDGRISEVAACDAPGAGDTIVDTLIPGLGNLHSHAFQRAMAGLAERRGPGTDSFWSWRTAMYDFALAMTPDEMEAVAAQLYCEMLEAGFTRVGEFHYLHHDADGKQFSNPAEMAERIAAASCSAGIKLTLLPVLYAHSGFGGKQPAMGQRRFINSPDSFAELHARCRIAIRDLPEAVLGVAPHSLRAVTPEELSFALALDDDGPLHIHIAEQLLEVEDCLSWCGARPVEWLLANHQVDDRWCLIHSTHVTNAESRSLARSGAVVGLCPITEANLGDGIFPASGYLSEGGLIGVGSDSNVLVGAADELRQLEYSQRLMSRQRNVIAEAGGSTGRRLFDHALKGGARALGASPSGIARGAAADLVALRNVHGLELSGDRALDAWIFTRSMTVENVWSAGCLRVAGGQHVDRGQIGGRFTAAMQSLAARVHS
jgi:formiminoglutamate deiminase